MKRTGAHECNNYLSPATNDSLSSLPVRGLHCLYLENHDFRVSWGGEHIFIYIYIYIHMYIHICMLVSSFINGFRALWTDWCTPRVSAVRTSNPYKEAELGSLFLSTWSRCLSPGKPWRPCLSCFGPLTFSCLSSPGTTKRDDWSWDIASSLARSTHGTQQVR